MDSKIKWQEPPPPKGGGKNLGGVDAEFATELRTKPGVWAVWRENADPNLASSINKGRRASFTPAGAFEATSRRNGKGDRATTIYVRFVGDPS